MKPFTIYSETIDPKALNQFYEAMNLDCVVQGALMPDAHAGYALPIGAVVATIDQIFPSWVGYDIGCGMCAVPTTFKRKDVEENAKAIFDQIYRDVPVGFAHNTTAVNWSYGGFHSLFVWDELVKKCAPQKQIGTLGGGNHFIEIGCDENDVVWIIIHSGSRNVGHRIATHYMKLASGDGKAREGHYGLPVDSDEGRNYIADLAFGLEFALANRKLIALRVNDAIARYIPGSAHFYKLINRNHNHAELRMIDGFSTFGPKRKVWIHRKGATHAEEGMMGVIPGNMRDGSFIVRGKGNPDSLFSSSHGAGRVLGRSAAKEALNMEDFKSAMVGIQARVEDATLDESPMAYKNVFTVMEEQRDLVEVVHHVRPIINIKG